MKYNSESLTAIPPELQELYRGKNLSIFTDLEDTPSRPGVLLGHVGAANRFLELLNEADEARESLIVSGNGPMASGKSTLLCLIKERRPEAIVYKHEFDTRRGGSDIVSHSEAIHSPSGHFTKVDEILVHLDGYTGLVLVDELQFSDNTPEEISRFIGGLRSRGNSALLLGLNLDFRKEPWGQTNAAISESDHILLLTSRCVEPECFEPAWFTQRTINGEPAHYDDPVVVVGGVSGDVINLYEPKCEAHFRVRPARENNR